MSLKDDLITEVLYSLVNKSTHEFIANLLLGDGIRVDVGHWTHNLEVSVSFSGSFSLFSSFP